LGRARLRAARREVAKAVRARKARVVLVAPNIEPIAAQGGLDDQLDDILRTAEGNGTPVVFCGSRKKLGQARAPRRPAPPPPCATGMNRRARHAAPPSVAERGGAPAGAAAFALFSASCAGPAPLQGKQTQPARNLRSQKCLPRVPRLPACRTR